MALVVVGGIREVVGFSIRDDDGMEWKPDSIG